MLVAESGLSVVLVFFFFQAEDGIRDVAVTGVQTCALPIYRGRRAAARSRRRLIRYTGARVKRVEDPRLLRGRGRYLDDIVLPRMVSLAFVRSPHAHAAIRRVDASTARRLDGVLGVFTADDLRALARPLAPRLDGDGFTPTAWPVLADGRVNFCGEAG